MESISGSSSDDSQYTIHYHDSFGFSNTENDPGYGTADPWTYYFPQQINITLQMSVKADNPIGIHFSGGDSGYVLINSDADVFLTGDIDNPNGDTTINTTGNITPSPDATIESDDLTLSAGGDIGTGNPLVATITKGGILDASSGSPGMVIDLTGGAILGTIAAAGNGPVVLDAQGSLQAPAIQVLQHGVVNVSGGLLTITSADGGIGSSAFPLGIESVLTAGAAGAKQGVNISALTDIYVVQPAGDLLVGQITSTGDGTVSVAASKGQVLDARGQSSAQASAPRRSRRSRPTCT